MTGVETVSDVEVIELLDFETENPCDWSASECGNAAAWNLTCRTCGAPFVLCDQHLSYHRDREARGWGIFCESCGTKTFPPFEDGFWITPIGGAL